jgi:hypothetical protein
VVEKDEKIDSIKTISHNMIYTIYIMSSTSKATPEPPKEVSTEDLMKKLEQDGAAKVQSVLKGNKPVTAESFLNIIQEGAKEFEASTGRPMTYAEMREAFG